MFQIVHSFQVHDGSTACVFDAENRITSTANSTTMSYTYDADGRRVKESSGTNYWYGPGGNILAETDSSGNWTNYIFFGGQRLARNIKILCLIAAMNITLGCTRARGPEPQEKESSSVSSDLLQVVTAVLEYNARSGSLLYRGDCTSSGGIADSFKIAAPERGVSTIEALHEAFANEPRLTVKADASGRIRVVGGDVQIDLLELRIPEIRFHDETDPRDATTKLLNLPEVRAYMQAHRTRFVSLVDGLVPMPRGAHLTVTMKDATISQALDRIAQTFPGVWSYGECAAAQGERYVDFRFHEFSFPPHSGPYPVKPSTQH